jgi:anti-sigma-K factor RskA
LNGTLSVADRNIVDAHCSGCERCAASLNLEQRVLDSIRAPRDNIGQSPHSAWQSFEARLEREAPRRARPTARNSWRSVAVGVALAAQAAALVAMAVLLILDRSIQDEPRFRTLSNEDATLSIGKPLVRIAFEPNVTESEVAAMASEMGGSIVAGPSPNNVYTLAFQPAPNGGSVDEKITLLRRKAGVLLVESVSLSTSR